VPFDAGEWQALAAQARRDSERLRGEMDAAAAEFVGGDLFGVEVRWDSQVAIKNVFKAAGINLESTGDDSLAGVAHPLAAMLRQYRAAQKLVTSYGSKFLKHAASDGRIYPNWQQIGADSGRMACGSPNVQQWPRSREYRQCVRAPEGR